MYETNPEDIYFHAPNSFNAILLPYQQMPGGESDHNINICLIVQLGYRLLPL